MKNYLLLITFLFIGCAPTGTVITFDDEKSNAIRAHYQNYEANNVEGLQALWSWNIIVNLYTVFENLYYHCCFLVQGFCAS